MSLAQPLLRPWNTLVRALEFFVIALFAALIFVVLWGVVSRYLPGVRPSDWTEELAIYLLVWLSLIGAALAYRSHGHLGVDYFVQKLDPAAQRLAGVVGELAVFGFAAFALVFGGWLLVSETLATKQTTAVLQWQAGYLYLAAPISGFFLCAFAVEHLVRPAPLPTEKPTDV
jgi:TRAP-type C4-dicarboxylate transport system permease small subunit